MIIKRIRRSARRQPRSLQEIGTTINVLSTYVLNASTDMLLAGDGEDALASYVLDTQILDGHATEPGEKVDLHGARRLVGNQLSQHQRQMLAATLLAPKAKDPIEHYVISWQQGELPVRAQIEGAVDIFASEMGYENCQIIWATHSNTPNYHLHLVVNRVDLVRRKVVTPAGGWDIDRLHQVAALIEDAQGWASEPNSIYTSRGGEVRERATGKVMRFAGGSREGCAVRRRASPERWREGSHEMIADELRAAVSWQDLHNRLSKMNAEYHQKGSGAELVIGSTRMKATSFGREFAYGRMTKKLGEFTPDPFRERDEYENYQAALRLERQRVREAWNEALDDIRERRKLLLKKAREDNEAYEALIAEARLKLSFDLAETEAKMAFDRARATIAANKLRREAWHKAGCPEPAQVVLPELVFAPNIPRDQENANAFGLAGFQCDHLVEYRRKDGGVAIRDAGVVLIVDPNDRVAIAASLSLAHTRGDYIPITGSQAFQTICREIAKAQGYTLTLHSGDVLYDPAAEDRNAVNSEPSGDTVSKASSLGKRTDCSLSSVETEARKQAAPQPALQPSKTKIRPSTDRSQKDDCEQLSDEIRWAALNGGTAGLGL